MIHKGFRFYPTSFYLAPFWYRHAMMKKSSLNCNNNKPYYKKYLEIIRDFVNRMNTDINRETPYFSFNIINYYKHEYLFLTRDFDLALFDLINEMRHKGYLDNTLFIIMSDHGSRNSKYSTITAEGRIERSTPLLGIKLPKRLWI